MFSQCPGRAGHNCQKGRLDGQHVKGHTRSPHAKIEIESPISLLLSLHAHHVLITAHHSLSFQVPHGQKSAQTRSCTYTLILALLLVSSFLVLSPVGGVSPASFSTAEVRSFISSSLRCRDKLTVNTGLVTGIHNLFNALSISPHRLPPDRLSKVSDRDPPPPGRSSGRLENAIKEEDEMFWRFIRSVKKIDGDTKRVHLDG